MQAMSGWLAPVSAALEGSLVLSLGAGGITTKEEVCRSVRDLQETTP
jgi:hypothetical protein